ncbi:SGNH/GDSL hydrolase family protein [Teichococcus aestuarii]|uniref:SGNH/GDSL hydrolase family protein n=1 Tax=Teichococcus aestuarii TaxID=568898 RepID=UPI003605C127
MAALVGAALLAAAPARGQAPPPVGTDNVPAACTVPDELRDLGRPLPRMAGLLKEKRPIRILAIGSSTTAGAGASSPSHAYPPRLKAALERLLPGIAVTVRNNGVGGEVASTTLARMRVSVEEWQPDVVLWQLGTNDALRGITPQAFTQVLREGVELVQRRGLDLVLIDPQSFPGIRDADRYEDFVEGIAAVAAEKRLPLMRRYTIMRFWQALPQPVLMLSADGFHMNDLGYQCMAEVLAGGIARRVTAAD